MRRLYLLASVLALAGCGGGGSSGPLPGPTATPAPVVPQGTLYVASANGVKAFPLNANGPAAPQRSLDGFYEQTAPGGEHFQLKQIATLGDGTLVAGITDYGFEEDVACSFSLYAPAATSMSQSSQRPCYNGPQSPGVLYSVVTRSDGSIDYLIYGGEVDSTRADGSYFTRLAVGTSSAAMAEDANGDLYLSRSSPNRIDVYRGGLVFGPTPSASIPLPGGPGQLAVAPDGTLYVAYYTSAGYVAAFAPSGQTRTIGPLANGVSALAVDRIGELYVAENGGAKLDVVDVFAANANGAAAPLRELATPIGANTPYGGAQILSIAIAD